MPINTVCIRCGKERIVSKRWKEYVGTSMVTFSTSVCPDPECQKIVDRELQEKKDRLENIQATSLKRRGNKKKSTKIAKKK